MGPNARTSSFENVKEQVGYCGIWCGSCVVGNGSLRELTKKYGELLGQYGVLEWGAKDCDAPAFLKGLESIKGIPVCPGCVRGGDATTVKLEAVR